MSEKAPDQDYLALKILMLKQEIEALFLSKLFSIVLSCKGIYKSRMLVLLNSKIRGLGKGSDLFAFASKNRNIVFWNFTVFKKLM